MTCANSCCWQDYHSYEHRSCGYDHDGTCCVETQIDLLIGSAKDTLDSTIDELGIDSVASLLGVHAVGLENIRARSWDMNEAVGIITRLGRVHEWLA